MVQGLTRYVILFFDVMPNKFNESTIERVLGKLSVIASELKVQEAYQQLASLQSLALRGELTFSIFSLHLVYSINSIITVIMRPGVQRS